MEEIAIGVRYQALGDPTTNLEESVYSKHWVLVFSGRDVAFTIEAVADGSRERPEILMEVSPCSPSYDAFRLGSYSGRWFDFERILRVHPQRGSIYSVYFNNCQHFVALFLLFLNALAKSEDGKQFNIDNGERYARIKRTLGISGDNVWNKPNLTMSTLSWATIGGGGAAARAAVLLAEAQQVVTVPAGGLLGFFGATQTTMVPAAYAGFAAACVPVALTFVGLTAGHICGREEIG